MENKLFHLNRELHTFKLLKQAEKWGAIKTLKATRLKFASKVNANWDHISSTLHYSCLTSVPQWEMVCLPNIFKSVFFFLELRIYYSHKNNVTDRVEQPTEVHLTHTMDYIITNRPKEPNHHWQYCSSRKTKANFYPKHHSASFLLMYT